VSREIGTYERIAMIRRRDELLERYRYGSYFRRDEGAELDRLIAEIGEPEKSEVIDIFPQKK
jgi:hypothetical protein